MNCCDRFIILFVIFTVIQYTNRWQRDFEVKRYWEVLVKGSANVTSVQTSQLIYFDEPTIPNSCPLKIKDTNINSTETERIYISLYAEVKSNPLAFHRLFIADRIVSIVTNHEGVGSSNVYFPFDHFPSAPLSIEYIFDSTFEIQNPTDANVSVRMLIHSIR